MDFRKQTNKDIAINNSNSNLTIFKDESFSFLYKKTERISTAIYLITNLMSVDEPIKWQLRKTSLGLLDNVMLLSNATMSYRESVIRDISKKLFQLISLYNVSFRSGFISEMNYRIVNQELNKLADFLGEYDLGDNQSRNNLFKEDFFTENIVEPQKGQIEKDISIKDNINRNSETVIKDSNYVKDNIYKRQDKMSYTNVFDKNANGQNLNTNKKTQKDNERENKSTNAKQPETTNKSEARKKRREDITNIIKQKGKVSVKDISSIIKDTSEKTIQRELVSMVDDGVLEKEGERRWSRYMIKKQ